MFKVPAAKALPVLSGLLASVFVLFGQAAAQTTSVFTSSTSTIPSTSDMANATAAFSLSGTTLTITLTNNGITSSNASILDGLFFNSNTSAPVNLLPSVMATQSWNRPIVSSNVNYTGGWQMLNSVTAPGGSAYNYGLSAVGANIFSSAAFTQGNGGDDYGLIGNATCPSGNCSTSANKPPLGVGSLVFTVVNFMGTSISSVALLYNSGLTAGVSTTRTSGTGNLAQVAVPEPMSVALLGTGVAFLTWVRRRRQGSKAFNRSSNQARSAVAPVLSDNGSSSARPF